MSFKDDLLELITNEIFNNNNFTDLCLEIFRDFFEFFALYDQFHMEGLKFFESFHNLIKNPKFNSIKAFLLYFAYQTKRYTSPSVKGLLNEDFINAKITEPQIYLEFCIYCFYRGLLYIEKKNFFMATYFYCTPLNIGLNNELENIVIFNDYSLQMARALCFLKGLSDFDISEYLFKKQKSSYGHEFEDKIKYNDMDEILSFLKRSKINLSNFNNFLKNNKTLSKDYKLDGLKKECEQSLILKLIKENLSIYKKIKLTKLATLTGIEFESLMKVIKKKCLDGELNVKYDEESDIIEVFDVEPSKKENILKTQELYKNILEGNKNLFINLRDKKLNELNNEVIEDENILNMINHINLNADDDD